MASTKLAGSGARMRLLPKRFHASRAERVISKWVFPSHIWRTVARRYPQAVEEETRGEIDHALRDWFICCAWRGRRPLGMPSRLVDEAWHALILDSLAYVYLCREAYGTYLHHFPETMSARDDDSSALVNTVWAWDRSKAGQTEESLLWDLDVRHGVEDALGVPEWQLSRIRTNNYAGGGEGWVGGGGGGADCPPDAAIGGPVDGGGGGSCGGGGGCGGGS